MSDTADLSRFCCQNPDCPDYGKRGHGNLTSPARYGRDRRLLLRCRTCKARFSERKGTPLFGARLSRDRLSHAQPTTHCTDQTPTSGRTWIRRRATRRRHRKGRRALKPPRTNWHGVERYGSALPLAR